MRRATGVIIAPPIPWMTREPINKFNVGEAAHNSEPIQKMITAYKNTRRVPYLSAKKPLIGIKIAKVSA